MNPCPCGHLGSPLHACRCTPDQVARYQGRLSGPLLDRIDLHIEVPAIAPQELLEASAGEPSGAVRERVIKARARAISRQGHPNQAMQGAAIDTHAALEDGPRTLLHRAATKWGWSSRATHRVLKVARTIADLAGTEQVEAGHLAEAMQYRSVRFGTI